MVDYTTLTVEQLNEVIAAATTEIARRSATAAPRDLAAELAAADAAWRERAEAIAYRTDNAEVNALRARVDAIKAKIEAQPKTWAVEDGCVDQEPINWCGHGRGKNWMATVSRVRTRPNGLARTFWAKASQGWCRVPANLVVGDVVEAAADYADSKGRNKPDRAYFEVTGIVAGKSLTVRKVECPSA